MIITAIIMGIAKYINCLPLDELPQIIVNDSVIPYKSSVNYRTYYRKQSFFGETSYKNDI